MARKISLALYQLSINRKGKRDDRIVLSNFMNGFDIIDITTVPLKWTNSSLN